MPATAAGISQLAAPRAAATTVCSGIFRNKRKSRPAVTSHAAARPRRLSIGAGSGSRRGCGGCRGWLAGERRRGDEGGGGSRGLLNGGELDREADRRARAHVDGALDGQIARARDDEGIATGR